MKCISTARAYGCVVERIDIVELDAVITIVTSCHISTRVTDSHASRVVIATRSRVTATFTACNTSISVDQLRYVTQ